MEQKEQNKTTIEMVNGLSEIADYMQGEELTAALTFIACLLYTSPSPRDRQKSRMPSSA